MYADRMMYNWRRLTPEQRQEVLMERKRQRRPLHSPPHFVHDSDTYLITAACYEHRAFIGKSSCRMASFESRLLKVFSEWTQEIYAWNLLPNHYHVLVYTTTLKELLHELGQLHGKTSRQWNKEERVVDRKIWHGSAETGMKSDRHFFASLNYVLHNAVRHGYAKRWQEWPFSNANEYLEQVGRAEAKRRWHAYPIDRYGDRWDPPNM